uniref:Uncharacterized protein n=1 Tax=Rhizophora mucronata TaxID=61149 RepID=A0A2P2IJL2_RHIMU
MWVYVGEVKSVKYSNNWNRCRMESFLLILLLYPQILSSLICLSCLPILQVYSRFTLTMNLWQK